jgi:hypothetical protein
MDNEKPAYYAKDIIKQYIYSYVNKVRSSRNLELESKRNIE